MGLWLLRSQSWTGELRAVSGFDSNTVYPLALCLFPKASGLLILLHVWLFICFWKQEQLQRQTCIIAKAVGASKCRTSRKRPETHHSSRRLEIHYKFILQESDLKARHN